MGRMLLTREQYVKRFGIDPEAGADAPAPAVPLTTAAPTSPTGDSSGGGGRKMLLTRDQFKGRYGYDPESGPPGWLESAARGAFQGATFGFGDELVGGAEALATGKPYDQARNESRAANEAARRANPFSYGAGDVAGSIATAFVPGLGVANGASAAARIGLSVGAGALAGAGYSNADVADSQFVRDVGTGAAGGLIGGVANEGVGRLIANAPKRVENRMIQDITEGAKPSLNEKLMGKAGVRRPEVVKFLNEEPQISRAAQSGNPDKLYAAVKAERERLGPEIGNVYKNIDDEIGVRSMQRRLNAVHEELMSSPETRAQGQAVYKEMENIWESWGTRKQVRPEELRKVITGYQEDARAYYRAALTGGAPPDTAAAKKIAADTLRDLLYEHVEQAAAKNPQKVGTTLAQLKDLNRRYSLLSDLEDVAATKAGKDAYVPPKRLGWLFDVGLGFADPTAFIAKKVLVDSGLGKHAVRAGDVALAKLVQGARMGISGDKLKLMASQLGVSAAVADSVGAWANNKMGGGPVSAQPMTAEPPY